MQRALWSAATGMQAQQTQIDTIANNLANVNTTAFKTSRAEFSDLLYRTVIAPGTSSSSTSRHPSGIQIGLGSRTVAVKKLFNQGELKQTDNELDLAIAGDGFFKVTLPDGTVGYTRDGAFTLNDEGQLVTSAGYPLDPPVTIPSDALTVTVGKDGTVSVRQPDSSSELGQLEIANFTNPTGLIARGNNIFVSSEASGQATDGTPGLDGLGEITQGALEVSNVSVVNELIDMIAAQRAYELNSRSIRASDEMLQQLNQIIR